jgi:NADH:ubiquinone oxidoreductase subunit 6 (subunit J)
VPAGKDCVPLPLVGGVGLNVGAYLTLGLLALGYLWARRLVEGQNEEWDGPTTTGIGVVTGVWLLIGAAFFFARPQFLQYAHYASAISFFVILGAVVFINASYTAPIDPAIDKPASWYRGWYRVIAWLMVGFALFGVAVFLLTGTQNYVYTEGAAPFPVIFWVEVVLLTLFILYWVLQTVELWNQTVPGRVPAPEAAREG